MECPNCSFENTPGTAACVRCGSLIDLGGIDIRPPRRVHTGLRSWLARRRAAVDGVLGRLAWWTRTPRLRWVLWCLVPGTGQIAAGRRRLGWALLALWLAGVLGAVAMAGTTEGWFSYGLALSVHSVSLAVLLGPTLRRQNFSGIQLAFGGMLIFLVLHYAVYGPVRYLASGWAVAIQLAYANPSPLVRSGDVLLCQGWFARSRQFQRGDVVLYNLNPHRPQPGENFYILGYRNVDRVIGLPGETVSIHKGQLRVNGQPVALGPLAGLGQFPDLEITAGADEYIIMPSLMGLNWPGAHNPQAPPTAEMYPYASRVRAEDILGRVTWRLRPLSRFGPLEQAR